MDDREDAAGTRGLFRACFGGEDGSVAATFRNLATADVSRRVDEHLGLFYARFDLPAGEGSGAWHCASKVKY